MARNYVTLDQIISDYIIQLDGDDYVNNVSDTMIRTFAKRGLRELGFDVSKRIRSLKIPVNTSTNTAVLPDDYVDWSKVGVVGSDGLVYVLGENTNLNYSQKYSVSNGVNYDSDGDGLNEREDSKTATSSGSPAIDTGIASSFNSYLFNNYIYGGESGAIYGYGGGKYYGEFRMNLDQNRIELDTNSSVSEIVVEYVADEARSTNPQVHAYLEQALQCYVYYQLVRRKSSVPANEKARAKEEYYLERRNAKRRMSSFTKEEALKVIRKNFKQSPKG